MKSGVLWLVLVAFKKEIPLSFITGSRPEAIKSIANLPKTDGTPLLFKLAFYKGRIYATRQLKIV
jgi:hypothetical protein